MRRAATLVFSGAFHPAAFIGFVDHRARRLDLAVVVGEADATRISVTVDGEPDLIDAFEMACSLGPIDCLVRTVERDDAARLAPVEHQHG